MTIIPNEDETLETIEDVGGEFGFRLRWRCKSYWADVEVWEIHGRHDGAPLFWEEEHSSNSITEKWTPEFPKYIEGFVKWDGCSEFDFHGHFCGAEAYIKHFSLLKYIYIRAGQLSGHNHIECPWPKANEHPAG